MLDLSLSGQHSSSPSAFAIEYDCSPSPLKALCSKYSRYSTEAISALYDVFGRDYLAANECLACGVSIKQVLGVLQEKFITIALEEGPKIRLEIDDTVDDWIDSAFSFYKGTKFLKNAPVRLVLLNQPAIDAGGISRQFFSEIYERLALGSHGLFEGEKDAVRPVFNMGLVPVMKIFGIMIAHSLLIERIVFPYLSPSLYYYMLGHHDVAASLIKKEESSAKVQHVLNEVNCILIIM
jgi:hypothetical protein